MAQIGDQGLVVLFEDLRADRHLEHDVGGVGAGPQAPHAMAAGRGLEMLLVAIVDQRVEAVDGLDPDIAALAAVAAIGAADFDEFFAPERHRPRTAVAGADIDLCLVEKFHRATLLDRSASSAKPLFRKGNRPGNWHTQQFPH